MRATLRLTATLLASVAGLAACTLPSFDAGGKECGGQLACPGPYRCEALGEPPLSLCVRRSAFQSRREPTEAYDEAADTFLNELQPNTSLGISDLLKADGDEANDQTNKKDLSLLRWGLQPAPELTELHAVALDLRVIDGSDAAFQLYPMRADWDELGATWRVARTGAPWGTAGGLGPSDRDETVVGEVAAPGSGISRTWLNPAGVELVRRWLDDPTTNHGLQLMGTSANALVFASKEDAARNFPSRLVLYWH